MSFGADFDDEFFDRLKENIPESAHHHESSTCLQEWLLDCPAMTRSEKETLECLKHKADYQYFHKDFAGASISYEKCLRCIPVSSAMSRRTCTEYLLCSLLNMGSADKALEWALKMDASAANTDEKIHSLNLLARVCHALGRHEEELEALHSCLGTHECNPDLWFRIACCYSGLFKIPLPNSSHKLEQDQVCCEFKDRLCHSVMPERKMECHERTALSRLSSLDIGDDEEADCLKCRTSTSHNGEILVPSLSESPELDVFDRGSSAVVEKCDFCILGVQMIAACLMKAKLLLNSEGVTMDADKSTKLNDKINNYLKHMEVEQSFIDEASKMLMFAGLPSAKLENAPMFDNESLP